MFSYVILGLVGRQGESMATLRDHTADLQERDKQAEARTHELPHRRKYMLLVSGFLRELLERHLRLVNPGARELADDESINAP